MKKELPSVDLVYDQFFLLQNHTLKWELLETAIDLKIFNYTQKKITKDELANQLNLDPANTGYMLDGLVALDYLSKRDGLYQNRSIANNFLAEGSETYLGEALIFMGSWMKPLLGGGLKNLVKNGAALKEDVSNPSFWKEAAKKHINFDRAGKAQNIASFVRELPEFDSFEKILDMGAGPGIIGLAITAIHPRLKCILMDQPEVCEVSRGVIQEYGMQDRMNVLPGDYMTTSLGKDYDFILASFTLNFYQDEIDILLRKISESLTSGGVFMVISDGLTNEKTKPTNCIINWLPTFMQGIDMSFESGFIAQKMKEAGFKNIQIKTIDSIDDECHGEMEVTIGRKL